MSATKSETGDVPIQSRFLDLPTEIRQKILLFTITDEDLVGERIGKKRGNPRKDDGYVQYWIVREISINFWAQTLGLIHPIVRKEMRYVLKKWVGHGKELLKDMPYILYDLGGKVLSKRIGCPSTQ